MSVDEHRFLSRPHAVMAALSAPMLVSLIAEPLAGLVDTVLIGRLGARPLAALGVATSVMSSVLWGFNFLGIGTQTEIARGHGSGELGGARELLAAAMGMGLVAGLALLVVGVPLAEPVSRFMGTVGGTTEGAVTYLRIRLLGAPAVLLTMAAFGALRGVQDMKTPLWIALGMNAINLALDFALIFGLGPFPRLGLAGAAWASVIAQWIGAGLSLRAVARRVGLPRRVGWRHSGRLLVVGRDLFVRTGLLLLFLTFGVRAATRIGTDAGAAHALIRSVWTFTAFLVDAYAHVAQSLVGYFLSAGRRDHARRVAAVSMRWSLVTGTLLAAAMIAATPWLAAALPPQARAIGIGAWRIAALSQLVSAVSFATDGIHWGTGDYRFLRNVMCGATGLGVAGLLALEPLGIATLDAVWWVTAGWLLVRAALGALRIWPGVGAAPLGRAAVLRSASAG